jgi:RNase H
VLKIEVGKKISHDSKLRQAEILGIAEITKSAINLNLSNKKFLILLDNVETIKSLSNPVLREKTTKNCVELLNKLASHNEVTIAWIPGHSNLAGNETSNKLAREASLVERVDITCPKPQEIIQKTFELFELQASENWWNAHKSSTKHACLFIKGYEPVKAKWLLNLKKRDLRVMTGILTGRSLLKNYLYAIGKSEDSLCEWCLEDDESILHLFSECEATLKARISLLGLKNGETDKLSTIGYSDTLKFSKEIYLHDTFNTID